MTPGSISWSFSQKSSIDRRGATSVVARATSCSVSAAAGRCPVHSPRQPTDHRASRPAFRPRGISRAALDRRVPAADASSRRQTGFRPGGPVPIPCPPGRHRGQRPIRRATPDYCRSWAFGRGRRGSISAIGSAAGQDDAVKTWRLIEHLLVNRHEECPAQHRDEKGAGLEEVLACRPEVARKRVFVKSANSSDIHSIRSMNGRISVGHPPAISRRRNDDDDAVRGQHRSPCQGIGSLGSRNGTRSGVAPATVRMCRGGNLYPRPTVTQRE